MDLAETQGNVRLMAEHVMAHDKVLYKGHALAAVAAANRHIAEQAVELIEVDYQVLPTVLTLHDALKPDAPLLHENLTTMFKVERFGKGDDTGVQSNVAGHIQHKLGDIEKGFAEADIIVEREFETQTVHQGYIEPHAATAVWAPEGADWLARKNVIRRSVISLSSSAAVGSLRDSASAGASVASRIGGVGPPISSGAGQ